MPYGQKKPKQKEQKPCCNKFNKGFKKITSKQKPKKFKKENHQPESV